jgi:hypothetical protein
MLNQYYINDLDPEGITLTTNLCLEEDIGKEYECIICFKIPKTPSICASCEKVICLECRSNPLFVSQNCPHCKSTLALNPLGKLANNILSNIILKCPNSGCDEKIKYQNIFAHYEDCSFTERVAVCEGCYDDIKTTNQLKEIDDHIENCGDVLTACKYCEMTFKRNFLDTHYNECSEREIECRYCKIIYKSSELNEHKMGMCVETATELLQEKVKDLEKKINSTDTELERVKGNYFINFR